MKYRIGLDIGIGSIGWSVISGEFGKARIENFGTRVFESGENAKDRASLCQERRGVRSVRRLERRRSHRKLLLKNHLDYIGILPADFPDELAAVKDADVYRLKAEGIKRKLSAAELYRCLIHTCNHRGYREFYEDDEDDASGENKKAVSEFRRRFEAEKCATVSEYLLTSCLDGEFVKYRNRSGRPDAEYLLVDRKLLENEAQAILEHQQKYYPQLTEQNIARTMKIIFAQRDFEDGPGDKNDETRRYQGFLAMRGACPFYKEDKRGFRATVLADVFAVTNTLSQYRFVNVQTGEYALPPEVAKEIVSFVLKTGNVGIKDLKALLKPHGLQMIKSENSDDKAISNAIHFLKPIKQCIESAGESWESWIAEEQFDLERPSKLHRIGELLSTYQTPRRRKDELKKLSFVSEELSRALCQKKLTGTAAAGYRYMCDAIEAFCNGEIYGHFQDEFLRRKNDAETLTTVKTGKLAPAVIDDREVKENRVVFKAINETRKIINAIIETYGAPSDIVVEVADELGRSFAERGKIQKQQSDNEKRTLQIKQSIIELLHYDSGTSPNEIKPDMVDRYKLYMQQEGKCLYSGKPLGELRDVLLNTNKMFEVDHIVPFSLILDNTLTNKALVFAEENQKKGQRTPLMYLSGDKKEEYAARVRHLYNRDNDKKGKEKSEIDCVPVSAKKLEYLLLSDVYSPEGREKIGEWKSRNINDTRYITKYIIGIIDKNLKFADGEGKHVWGVKGAVTSRFRRVWLAGSEWGAEQKDRSTYLNHAVDATVLACLTPAYIEIASDGIKLRNIYHKYNRTTASAEYQEYLEKCKDKMQRYYGFAPDYTKKLLQNPDRVPSYVDLLREEVDIRFNDFDEKKFNEEIAQFYLDLDTFVIPPHIPITSHKQNIKYQGQIADANPIRLVNIDGADRKVKREAIDTVTAKTVADILTTDDALLSTLHRIFEGKDDKYSVADYLKENDLSVFVTDAGQKVHKVSVVKGAVNVYAKKEIGDGNYSILGGLCYYCFELYKNTAGATCLRGVKMTDIVKKNKKLYVKAETIPADYQTHIMYLSKGDYVTITDGKGQAKFAGYLGAAYNINQSMLCFALNNTPYLAKKAVSIAKKDTVRKYSISLLGCKGGEVKRSEPLSLIRGKESE